MGGEVVGWLPAHSAGGNRQWLIPPAEFRGVGLRHESGGSPGLQQSMGG